MGIVKMKDYFVFKGHLCIVFEMLFCSLYETLYRNEFKGLSLNLSRLLITQIVTSLAHCDNLGIIHCDLKPENILLVSEQSTNLKVIDFGSACFEGGTVHSYVQSRYYRSPEVLMELPYTSRIDMWSLGCLAVELVIGTALFPGKNA